MDAALFRSATTLGRRLKRAGLTLATAESCTGGWIAKALTDVPGSSQWVECGFVTYSNAAKERLGVRAATLRASGAVSAATVEAMARAALRVAGTDVAVAVSGIAGPDGGTPGKPVGTVWFAVAVRGSPGRPGRGVRVQSVLRHLRGDREAVRRKSVLFALRLVGQAIRAP